MTPTLLRDSWGYGIYFYVYESLKNLKYPIQADGSRADIPMYYILPCGSATGMIMWALCFPLDLVKTEMQVDNLKKPRFANTLEATKHIYKTYGLGGFYRGLSPCVLRGLPVNAAVFGSFELATSFLKKY